MNGLQLLSYSLWLELPLDVKADLASVFHIRKTGTVIMNQIGLKDGVIESVIQSDGYTPNDLRAISVEAMQNVLMVDKSETDFYKLFHEVRDNIKLIKAGTYKHDIVIPEKDINVEIINISEVIIPKKRGRKTKVKTNEEQSL